MTEILVRDGVPQTFEGDYATLKYSRTALGIKADGTIVTYTTHGISAPTSCGETYNDVAKILAAQGCVIALNIDGGGSSTSISMREGTNTPGRSEQPLRRYSPYRQLRVPLCQHGKAQRCV